MRGRMSGGILLALFALLGALLWPQTAKADPHAVFYTAIGQRQLFFNFLAALNQADYVEPATGDFSRDELVALRKLADEAGSVEDGVNATRTELAAVLTRLITLEGTDLWSDYIARQVASGAAQKTNATAYIKLMCAQGLGRKFSEIAKYCENDALVGAASIDQQRAFVVNPAQRTGLAYQHGLEAVYSDRSLASDYQKTLQDLQDPQARQNSISPDYPVPWDEPVAALREKVQGTGNDFKEMAADRLSMAATGAYRSPHVDDSVFNLLQRDSSGEVSLKDVPEAQSGADKLDLYLATMQGLVDLPQQFMATAARGASAAEQHLAATDAEGGLAPVQPQQTKSTTCNGGTCPAPDPGQVAANPSLGHQVNIAAPPFVNREQVAAGLSTLGAANANPLGIPPGADEVPGTEQTLPNVAGLQDDQRGGRVLHATSPSTQNPFTVRPGGLDFSTNPTAAHEEQGPKHFLLALTDGSRDRSGCGCGINMVLNDLGQAILGKVNGWRL